MKRQHVIELHLALANRKGYGRRDYRKHRSADNGACQRRDLDGPTVICGTTTSRRNDSVAFHNLQTDASLRAYPPEEPANNGMHYSLKRKTRRVETAGFLMSGRLAVDLGEGRD
jgi:hypothetical protein